MEWGGAVRIFFIAYETTMGCGWKFQPIQNGEETKHRFHKSCLCMTSINMKKMWKISKTTQSYGLIETPKQGVDGDIDNASNKVDWICLSMLSLGRTFIIRGS